MNMFKLLCISAVLIGQSLALNEDFLKKLGTSKGKTESALKGILEEWNVKDYPNFLKSCFMHKQSWDVMKYKLMHKILDANREGANGRQKYVVSFLGSSVTAGHDNFFNLSTSEVTGNLMRDAFVDSGVDFVARNAALGNNPCMPYDICVKYFAGYDADMVHWEQNYFCDGNPIMEQFIRQAMTSPSQPIVIFSEAQTGHWGANQCKTGPHQVTEKEKELLNADPLKLVSELNKDEHHRAWGFVAGVEKTYRGAGIQTFTHLKHTDYACLGPYIKTWEEGAASWHPSAIAHRMRGSHHAYFWLLIWLDALKELQSLASHRAIDAISKDVIFHISTQHPPMPSAVHKSNILDDMKCYTDYEPRAQTEVSLKDRVVSGLVEDENAKGWHFVIYENLVDKSLVQKSLKMGYHDFKKLMYGDNTSGPLSLTVPISRTGPVLICETPGIWGKLPSGFVHFFESKAEVYLTADVKDKAAFKFDKAAAKKVEIHHTNELDICSMLHLSGTGNEAGFPVGEHVLTIVPTVTEKIIFAWLVTP